MSNAFQIPIGMKVSLAVQYPKLYQYIPIHHAVATGGPGEAAPPYQLLVPLQFRLTQNTVYGTSHINRKATEKDGKTNNYVQT